jgi:urate oxidase
VTLVSNRYGKGRVRIMRVNRNGEHYDVSELSIKAMLEGEFARTYTDADNSKTTSTDTIKNVANVVARENLSAGPEEFCDSLASRYLELYPQATSATITAHQTKWNRLSVAGKPHPHSFVLDSNGKPFVELYATRDKRTLSSGIDGFTFMKATQSGWSNFFKDRYSTLAETDDRICATSMLASWQWAAKPADYAATNRKVLDVLLEVFATTYSPSVQNSLYRMGEAVLAAVPEIFEISMACPNIHYIPINLGAFEITNDNQVFLPTEEPHGQIECTVSRG